MRFQILFILAAGLAISVAQQEPEKEKEKEKASAITSVKVGETDKSEAKPAGKPVEKTEKTEKAEKPEKTDETEKTGEKTEKQGEKPAESTDESASESKKHIGAHVTGGPKTGVTGKHPKKDDKATENKEGKPTEKGKPTGGEPPKKPPMTHPTHPKKETEAKPEKTSANPVEPTKSEDKSEPAKESSSTGGDHATVPKVSLVEHGRRRRSSPRHGKKDEFTSTKSDATTTVDETEPAAVDPPSPGAVQGEPKRNWHKKGKSIDARQQDEEPCDQQEDGTDTDGGSADPSDSITVPLKQRPSQTGDAPGGTRKRRDTEDDDDGPDSSPDSSLEDDDNQ